MKEWFNKIVSRKSYAQELLEYLFHNKLCDEHYYDYFVDLIYFYANFIAKVYIKTIYTL
jgi:hypothetical protein